MAGMKKSVMYKSEGKRMEAKEAAGKVKHVNVKPKAKKK